MQNALAFYRRRRTVGSRAAKKYKPEYCEMLIAHMSQGKTIKDFAKKIGISTHTLTKWAHIHPEFMDAKDIGHYKSRMRDGS
jgi:transposase-like protein